MVAVLGFTFVSDMLTNGERAATTVIAAEAERSFIPDNIYVNGIYVGGLSMEDALERLSGGYDSGAARKQLVVTAEEAELGARLVIGFDELSPGFDFTQGVIAALNYGLDEDQGQLRARLAQTPARLTAEPIFSYDDAVLAAKLEEFLQPLERQAVNASSERRDGTFHVTDEVVGLVADMPATLALARAVVATNEGGEVAAVLREVEPTVTAASLRNATSLLGTFTTHVSGAPTLGRNVNIVNAANHVNDTVVAPGEVFSTNYHMGAMTYANGYRYAPIILNGEFVDGIGGGVCQVSSTLYMALLFAEMEIVERRNHSLRVNYIDWSMDAALAGTWIDLRWRNNTDHPVYVEITVIDGAVTANIFGYESRPANRTISFAPMHLETIAHDETIIEDPEMAYGERVVESRGTNGQRHALYKTVMVDGVQVDRYRVNTSTYRTVNSVVRVGTAGAPTDADTEIDGETGDAGVPDISGLLNDLNAPQTQTIINSYTGEEMNIVADVPAPVAGTPAPVADTSAPVVLYEPAVHYEPAQEPAGSEMPDFSSWLNFPTDED